MSLLCGAALCSFVQLETTPRRSARRQWTRTRAVSPVSCCERGRPRANACPSPGPTPGAVTPPLCPVGQHRPQGQLGFPGPWLTRGRWVTNVTVRHNPSGRSPRTSPGEPSHQPPPRPGSTLAPGTPGPRGQAPRGRPRDGGCASGYITCCSAPHQARYLSEVSGSQL